jgi:hypothetical protein
MHFEKWGYYCYSKSCYNNLFTGIPTVSVYGGGLPTVTAILNPYNIATGGYSFYQIMKRLRFDLNQEFKQ